MSFWAKLTYYNKKDYQFSFHYLQICYNVSILLLNERFLQALIRADSLPLCSRNSKKVWTRIVSLSNQVCDNR